MSPTEFTVKRLGLIPYFWQAEAMEAVAMGKQASVVAANGSGKTDRLVAPLVLWFLETYPKGKVVFTSGSFRQLSNQLWPAIKKHRAKFPRWTFLSDEIRTPEGGFALGFSTDDAGRAEGWHGEPDAPLFLIIDEAKTVPNQIFEAFDRCTRLFQLWTSSPGAPRGQFYDSHHKAKNQHWTRKVPSMECPHIPLERREKDRERYGEDHPLYRSKHLAEFTEDTEKLVMTARQLADALQVQPKADANGEIVAFCDFAAGRDENVFAVRRGNTARVVKAWVEKDTVQAVREFMRLFKEEGMKAGQIWGDADGLGANFCNDFAEHGWHINRFHGGQKSTESDDYHNLITEVWHVGAREIERGRIHLGQLDPTTFEQITSRRTEWSETGKLRLQFKEKMRAEGIKSPDRADALLGCIACGSRLTGAITAASVVKTTRNPFAAPIHRGFN